MKNKVYEKLLKSLKNPKQREIFQWLVHHYKIPFTALDTWNLLFKERHSEQPDVCIAMYDELNFEERIIVEHTFSTFVFNSIQSKPKKF